FFHFAPSYWRGLYPQPLWATVAARLRSAFCPATRFGASRSPPGKPAPLHSADPPSKSEPLAHPLPRNPPGAAPVRPDASALLPCPALLVCAPAQLQARFFSPASAPLRKIALRLNSRPAFRPLAHRPVCGGDRSSRRRAGHFRRWHRHWRRRELVPDRG